MGFLPKFTSPKEDVGLKSDLTFEIGERRIVISVKTRIGINHPILIRKDGMRVKVIINDETADDLRNSDYWRRNRVKSDELRYKKLADVLKEGGFTDAEPILIILPVREINPVTGKPSPELSQRLKELFSK